MAWTKVGTLDPATHLKWRGAYSSATQYATNDVVTTKDTSSGSPPAIIAWVAVSATLNNAPSGSSTYWSALGDPNTATTGYVNALQPTGAVTMFAGYTAPSGWLLCDGSVVTRAAYPALWTAIGTTYGTGNGTTDANGYLTFNLPNLVQKFPRGNTTGGTTGGNPNGHNHGLTAASMPLHTHPEGLHTHTQAHTHGLNAGAALISFTTGNILTQHVGTAAWTATHATTNVAAATATTGAGSGSNLIGSTDAVSTPSTGNNTTANTGNPSATSLVGTTDLDNGLPPFLDLMFIIKF